MKKILLFLIIILPAICLGQAVSREYPHHIYQYETIYVYSYETKTIYVETLRFGSAVITVDSPVLNVINITGINTGLGAIQNIPGGVRVTPKISPVQIGP